MGFLNSLRRENSQNGRVYQTQEQQEQRHSPNIQELRSNPVGLLRAEGYQIPDGMTDPKQLTQYIIQSGQVRNGRLGMIQKVINSLR